MKVLLGWELGAGQGHIQRLGALATALAARGWQPFFALKDYTTRGMELPGPQLEAPILPFLGRENSYTFADILATFGFGNEAVLRSHLQQWQDLLRTLQPALVITDHAPGLVLAARGLVPTIVVGSPFAVPPPVEVFPPFRSAMPPESAQQQQQVAEVVRRLVPLEVPLGQALNGDRSFIFSIPDIDCYGTWRSPPTAEGKAAEYVGMHVAPMPLSRAKPSDPVWSYLHSSYPSAELIVQTFQAETTFQPLPEALGRKSLAIHHGGLTTTVACALAGVPQIIVPRYIEQQLNGASVYRLGVAQMLINPTAEHLHPLQAQRQLLLQQAQGLAHRLSDWNCNRIEQVLESCQQFQAA